MHDMSDLRKSIAERLGSAAKFTMSAAKYRAFVYRGSPRSNVLVKATEWMDSAIAAEEAAKQIAMSFRGQPGYNSDNYFADIAQETPMGAKTVKNNVRFSRPGAKAKMANEEAQMRQLIGQVGAKPDKVIYRLGAFEMHYYGRAGKGDGEGRARRTLANLHAFMRRTGLDTQGAYYQPIDDRDPTQGGMIVLLASTFDKPIRASRPGAKAKMAYQPSEADWKKWLKGWTLRMPHVPDAGIRHFNSFEEAKRYADEKCGGFACVISHDGQRVASKSALAGATGSWTKHSRPGAKGSSKAKA
jgi:hypothetical protein